MTAWLHDCMAAWLQLWGWDGQCAVVVEVVMVMVFQGLLGRTIMCQGPTQGLGVSHTSLYIHIYMLRFVFHVLKHVHVKCLYINVKPLATWPPCMPGPCCCWCCPTSHCALTSRRTLAPTPGGGV